jgi:hypothetical protein
VFVVPLQFRELCLQDLPAGSATALESSGKLRSLKLKNLALGTLAVLPDHVIARLSYSTSVTSNDELYSPWHGRLAFSFAPDTDVPNFTSANPHAQVRSDGLWKSECG